METCTDAASSGHLEVLKWARENAARDEAPRQGSRHRRLRRKWAHAGRGGRGRRGEGRPPGETLKWARENGCPWDEQDAADYEGRIPRNAPQTRETESTLPMNNTSRVRTETRRTTRRTRVDEHASDARRRRRRRRRQPRARSGGGGGLISYAVLRKKSPPLADVASAAFQLLLVLPASFAPAPPRARGKLLRVGPRSSRPSRCPAAPDYAHHFLLPHSSSAAPHAISDTVIRGRVGGLEGDELRRDFISSGTPPGARRRGRSASRRVGAPLDECPEGSAETRNDGPRR